MQRTVTRYETMIRHDEAGRFKGGHHIDIVRWVPEPGEAAEDMPPPQLTGALPLSKDEMAALLTDDAAAALVGFSAVKGRELAARREVEALQAQCQTLAEEIAALEGANGTLQRELNLMKREEREVSSPAEF